LEDRDINARDNQDAVSNSGSGASSSSKRHCTVAELVASLGEEDSNIPPAPERRVPDFRFAQQKRQEKHGDNRPFGVIGLCAHLSDIRADLEWAEDADF
jgi:hypothetical protein